MEPEADRRHLLQWRLLLPLAAALLLYACLRLLDFFWWRPRRVAACFARQGIRGPPYRLFFGNVKEMVSLMVAAGSGAQAPSSKPPWDHDILRRVLAFYPHWRKIYGSTFLLWFGPTPRLAVSDPDLIREILVSRSDCYDKYESHPLVRQLEGDGLLSLTGDKWAHHRKLISPTFHMDNLRLLVPSIGSSVEKMVERWEAMCGGSGGEVEVDVAEWYQGLAEDAITHTAFGVSYEDGKSVFQLQAKQIDFAAEAFRNVFIPGYRFLPTQKNVDSWRLEREVNRLLVGLIGTRRKLSGDVEGCAGKLPRDLLGLLIRSAGGTAVSGREGRPALSVRDMVEECKTFFFAGKHTTSNLLTWATLLLAMHPDWQERARDEVLAVCGSRDPPARGHVTQLRTLGMVLHETLRLYPPAVALIRRAKADVALGGRYLVPRDTELLVPIVAVHHDPELWGPDAAEFNPGRFAEGVARAARHPTAYIPFGLGARTCIGRNLALLEAKVTLAIVLQRFRFDVSPSYVHAPAVLMLLHPQHGAPVVFRPISAAGPTPGGDV